MQGIIQESTTTFQPVDLVITIHNIEDLINLWAVFNASQSTKASNCNKYPKMQEVLDLRTDKIFSIIDNYLSKQTGSRYYK